MSIQYWKMSVLVYLFLSYRAIEKREVLEVFILCTKRILKVQYFAGST